MAKGLLWKPAPIELVKGSQDWKLGRGLEVGARVGVGGEGRGILALNNWEGKATPGGGWQSLGFGGPPPSPSGAACAVPA